MRVGIVGAEAAKFTPETEALACLAIARICGNHQTQMVISGGCHLGGVDIWTEEVAHRLGIEFHAHLPERRTWSGGYRERNLKIAQDSDVVHVIVVKELPPGYEGMRFKSCYHCHTTEHVKSGACWTGHEAIKLGKKAVWHVVEAKDVTHSEDPENPA